MIHIEFMYLILQLDKLYVCVCVCVFLVKTSHFIAVIIALTDETVDRFRLVKPIDRSIPANSHVFIPDAQAVDRFTWYGQAVD
jgi:hypothetical protein